MSAEYLFALALCFAPVVLVMGVAWWEHRKVRLFKKKLEEDWQKHLNLLASARLRDDLDRAEKKINECMTKVGFK